MTFDKNQDGKLVKSEVTDARLLPLFERADADNDVSSANEDRAGRVEDQPVTARRVARETPARRASEWSSGTTTRSRVVLVLMDELVRTGTQSFCRGSGRCNTARCWA